MAFIIAELGVNHRGSVQIAYNLIDAAADAGADAVKFQTFRAALLDPPGPQRDMLEALQFPLSVYADLRTRTEERGLLFLSTPFDPDSLRFLVELGVKRIKIASGQLENWPLLHAAKASGLPVLLSTGMSNYAQIAGAFALLGASRTTLLHCTSAYPCPPEDVNLRAMVALRANFGGEVGFSDHSEGIVAAIAAVALGAVVVEKHLTLDRSMKGPDHKASIEPDEFASMVQAIRTVETMMGDGIKQPRPSEAAAMAIAAERQAWRTQPVA